MASIHAVAGFPVSASVLTGAGILVVAGFSSAAYVCNVPFISAAVDPAVAKVFMLLAHYRETCCCMLADVAGLPTFAGNYAFAGIHAIAGFPIVDEFPTVSGISTADISPAILLYLYN